MRLTTGATITKDFTPTDTLRAVHNWVATARTDQRGGFALSTAYPRKDYSGSALDSTTLKAAGKNETFRCLNGIINNILLFRFGAKRLADGEKFVNTHSHPRDIARAALPNAYTYSRIKISMMLAFGFLDANVYCGVVSHLGDRLKILRKGGTVSLQVKSLFFDLTSNIGSYSS